MLYKTSDIKNVENFAEKLKQVCDDILENTFLSKEESTVSKAYYPENKTLKKISDELCIAQSTAGARLNSALRKLRKHREELFHGKEYEATDCEHPRMEPYQDSQRRPSPFRRGHPQYPPSVRRTGTAHLPASAIWRRLTARQQSCRLSFLPGLSGRPCRGHFSLAS